MIKCPFCKGEIKVQVTDTAGNFRNDEYEFNNLRGCCFKPIHYLEENEGCPIATDYDEGLGCYLYDNREEIAEKFRGGE